MWPGGRAGFIERHPGARDRQPRELVGDRARQRRDLLGREQRRAALGQRVRQAFEDKILWEQMQKAGEYLKLLTGQQAGDMVRKQAEVIEKYKDLLG